MKNLLKTSSIALLLSSAAFIHANANPHTAQANLGLEINTADELSVSIEGKTINNAVAGDSISLTYNASITADSDRDDFTCNIDSSLTMSNDSNQTFNLEVAFDSQENGGASDCMDDITVSGPIPPYVTPESTYSGTVVYSIAHNTETHN